MPEISNLLKAVNELEIVVPEFQREYVWTLDQSKELMTSLFLNYPTGSLLVWQTNTPPEIKNHAVKKEKMGWIQVLLDGQQRLTTLYLFIKGEIPPYYTKADFDGNDPRHLYFNLKTAEYAYYQKQKMETDPFWKSVVSCFTEKFDAFTLIGSLKIKDPQETLEIGKTVNENLNQLRNIMKIDYHVQHVPDGVNIDKAIDIFDRVNSQGTKLTDAELVLTHIAGKWPQARRKMKEKIEEFSKTNFDFSLDFLTRGFVVLLTNSALFKKMTDEVYANTSQEHYKNVWEQLVKILNYLVPILKQTAYISSSEDLSTNNVLIPIIAYLSKHEGAFDAKQKKHFLYWMFLASIWGRYSGQADQRMDKDVNIAINNSSPVAELINQIEDERGRIEIKPADLEGRGASHPLHRMLYVVAKYNKATDWANGGSLHGTMGDQNRIHSHHIFPANFLYTHGFDSENHLDKKKVNEIGNRAFITRDTNFDITDRDPAEYLKEVNKKYPEALKEQMIPINESLWHVEKYNQFLEVRRKMIADSINAFLEKLKGQEVKEKIDYRKTIEEGESDYVEFKASMRWDYNQNTVNKTLEQVIAKTISAFMNSEGGKLFIGVTDAGKIVGIEKDIETVHNKNKDGFLLHLVNVINQYLGKEFNQYIDSKIELLDGKDVCVVNVSNSDMPAYMKIGDKDEFYIRASAASLPMSLREANQYIKTHWENSNN